MPNDLEQQVPMGGGFIAAQTRAHDRSAHCCLCGQPRRPTQEPVESFGNGCRIVQMADHRPMMEGRWEQSPQLLVNVLMWRNGGTAPGQTHMCDGCILVGLQHAKEFVDASIAALAGAPA